MTSQLVRASAWPITTAQLCSDVAVVAAAAPKVPVTAWAMAMAQPVDTAVRGLPWGKVMSMPSRVTSFGYAAHAEEVLQGVQKRIVIVEAARGKTLARKQVTHYKCMSCRMLVPNEEKTCSNCQYTRAENGTLGQLERERERAASRQNTLKGRRRNKCSDAVVPASSLEVAPVSAFEREWSEQLAAKKQKVRQETEALAMARCGEAYVGNEDSHACVFESFLQVHYFGRLSVHDVSRIGGVD